MVHLKKAYKSEKNKLFPLILNGFEVDKYSKTAKSNFVNFFSELFKLSWDGKNEHIGYYLEDENKNPVGFNGFIFSSRKIGDKIYNFCNLSTWVVEKKYSRYGLLLYKPIESLKSTHIITNFSPSLPSQYILKRMKFKILDDTQYLIPFFPFILNFNCIKIKTQINLKTLNKNEKKIYRDHLNTKVFFVKCDLKSSYILIGIRKLSKKKLPFLEIMYLNDKNLFLKNISRLRFVINLKFRTLGFLIDSRFVSKQKISFCLKLKMGEPKLVYAGNNESNNIDNLYSESTIMSL